MSTDRSTSSYRGRLAKLRSIQAQIAQARVQELRVLAQIAARDQPRAELVSLVAQQLSVTRRQAGALMDLGTAVSRGEIDADAAVKAYEPLLELSEDLERGAEDGVTGL
ncbi:hypothetical protein [Amycolatopsis sp. H20-H5]|uniref:hypothetical protein n=1 Tax=Amycolatopsis sp. H20-H5 TaxID=3046309 RepID=UPI002DBC9806|nr:hypothetical protein [Amycolatopsis sp. H20-H5]MEC3976362.1 hypothetical protein [Amycolatopsis sp. H20-H5]